VTSTSSGKSWSSKDLLSLANSADPLQCKSRIQVATERLHDLYESLHSAEIKEHSDPFQPDVFLHALR
jgi:ubiquitin carboxyl-terminal hydrolase 1